MSWPMVKLKNCCQVVGGATPRRNVEEYWNSPDIPWVTPKDISKLGKPMLMDAPEYISIKGFESCTTSMLPKGSVLVTSRAPIGNIAIAGRNLCTNQGFKSLVPGEKVDGLYLYYCMSAYSERLQALGNGATFKEVSKRIVDDFEIPLPPLTEQKRIAAILDKADAIRRKRQQAIQLADDFLRAVFLDMFGDPVINPKGWEVVSIKELVKLQGGYAFKSKNFLKTGVPVVKIGNANKQGFTTKNIEFVKPENPEKLTQYELFPGDLLMSLTGTVGKDDYANVTEVTDDYEKYYLNQRVAKISIDLTTISKNYLKYYLAHPKIKREITKNNRGVRQANISNNDIYDLSVPVPPTEVLNIFDLLVSQITKVNSRFSLFPKLSANMFNSLTQRAFRGEL